MNGGGEEKDLNAYELMKRYNMNPHEENGKYICCHYEDNSGKRPASGSIYYYVSPGEHTNFHKIDCDEYWIFNAGSVLELWIVGLDGEISIRYLGITKDAEPIAYMKAGEIFASRLSSYADDGTFVTCITVPRFEQEGFEMYSREEIIKMFPKSEAFWIA